jgi:hypothetical protein
VRWFDAIPAHDHPDNYRPGTLREGDHAPLLYFTAVDIGLHGEDVQFVPGELMRVDATGPHRGLRQRAKLMLEPWQLHRLLGLPETGRVVGVYVDHDPERLYVVFEHPDLPVIPDDCEAPVITWGHDGDGVWFKHPDMAERLR